MAGPPAEAAAGGRVLNERRRATAVDRRGDVKTSTRRRALVTPPPAPSGRRVVAPRAVLTALSASAMRYVLSRTQVILWGGRPARRARRTPRRTWPTVDAVVARRCGDQSSSRSAHRSGRQRSARRTAGEDGTHSRAGAPPTAGTETSAIRFSSAARLFAREAVHEVRRASRISASLRGGRDGEALPAHRGSDEQSSDEPGARDLPCTRRGKSARSDGLTGAVCWRAGQRGPGGLDR